MLDTTELDLVNVWEIVKKARLSFLLEHSDSDCIGALLSDTIIQENINNLAAELNLKTTSTLNEIVSNETLKSAVEMFTYLNYCPASFNKFFSFSKYLFETGTPKQIILAMIEIMKTSQNAAKIGKVELFPRVMNIFNLFQYEQIQKITKGKWYTKGTFSNCSKKIKATNKDKLEILGFLY